MGTGGPFPGDKHGRDVTLTTHPHLVPKLRMSRSYTSSPPKRLRGVCWDSFFSEIHIGSLWHVLRHSKIFERVCLLHYATKCVLFYCYSSKYTSEVTFKQRLFPSAHSGGRVGNSYRQVRRPATRKFASRLRWLENALHLYCPVMYLLL
jgi:hypothetical protein